MQRLARAAAMVLVIGGSVFADEGAAPVQPQPGQASGSATGSDVDATFKQNTNLSPQEMLDQGQDDIRKMQEGLRRIVQLQDGARKQNDIIRLNCVNDKLVQVRAATNIGEQSMTDLQEASARNDDGARSHAFTKLTIALQKVQVLVSEGENCVGEDLTFVGESRVDVEIDKDLPKDDPTEKPLPYPLANRPPEASPFL
jgi:hypothetical protein